MPGALVSSAILTGANELIRAHGHSAAGIARRVGVPLTALHDPNLMVAGSAVIRFFELAALLCENRNWALELSLRARLATVIGPLWILLRNARTVRELCTELTGNFDLYSSAAVATFENQPDGSGVLMWSPAIDAGGSAVQMTEYALALLRRELSTHCAPGWQPQDTLFSHSAPTDLGLHHKLFGDTLSFNADRNALQLNAASLDQGLTTQTGLARSTIRSILRHSHAPHDNALASQVESIIRSLMPYGPCNLRDVSLAMGMAPRTLQKRLALEHTRFQTLRDRVRADLALKYVRDSRLHAAEIAEILGYDDATSLSRAFRRWHGRGIREARRHSNRQR